MPEAARACKNWKTRAICARIPSRMALLEEWILPGPVDSALSARIAGVLRRVLPESIARSLPVEGETLRVFVQVPSDALVKVALHLDEPLDHFDGWDWRAEIDALDEGDTYALCVECALKVPETFESEDDADEVPILSVYSKDGDNMAGWPVAFVLASRLAYELGAREPEGEPEVLN